MDTKRSKLYAIYDSTGEALDASIKIDILEDTSQYVFEEAFIEGDARFADPNFKFSDEFCDECTMKAKKLLGWE